MNRNTLFIWIISVNLNLMTKETTNGKNDIIK